MVDKYDKLPSRLFDFILKVNEIFRISEAFNRFAPTSLTQTAVLDTCRISNTLNYFPTVNFFNGYEEIVNWIHNEQGWQYYFPSLPEQKILQ